MLCLVMFLQLICAHAIPKAWSFSLVFQELLRDLPQFLLGEEFGMWSKNGCAATSGRWYLSAMIGGMAFLYPLLLKCHSFARKILLPLLIALALGYCQQTYKSLVLTYQWNGFVEMGLIRALAGMSLGVLCYDAALFLCRRRFTRFGKLLITILEWLAFGLIVAFTAGRLPRVEPLSLLFVYAFLVTLVYSRVGYSVAEGLGSGLQKVCLFLGGISLPLYLVHGPMFWSLRAYAGVTFLQEHFFLLSIFCILAAYLLLLLGAAFRRAVLAGLKKLILPDCCQQSEQISP